MPFVVQEVQSDMHGSFHSPFIIMGNPWRKLNMIVTGPTSPTQLHSSAGIWNWVYLLIISNHYELHHTGVILKLFSPKTYFLEFNLSGPTRIDIINLGDVMASSNMIKKENILTFPYDKVKSN